MLRRNLSNYIQSNRNRNKFYPDASFIDFRSDTVTRPTAEMLRAMQLASWGDNVYDEDETIHIIEKTVATLCGKDNALFCVSGTMSNQLALQALLPAPPCSVLLDARSHIYRYECAGIAVHSRAGVVPIKVEKSWSHLTVNDLDKNVIEQDIHCAPTRVIALENTLNGSILPLKNIQEIFHWAKQRSFTMHLDGARLWNASMSTGNSLSEYSKYFDTVKIGIGAPIGSVLVGSHETIERARHLRKLMGGGWRQAGGLAAAALYGIENIWPRMKTDHENTSLLAQGLKDLGFTILNPIETNMIFVDFGNEPDLKEKLMASKILISGSHPERLVLHHQISRDQVEFTLDKIKSVI